MVPLPVEDALLRASLVEDVAVLALEAGPLEGRGRSRGLPRVEVDPKARWRNENRTDRRS